MATRSARDNQKDLHEKHQAILARLTKDEDNKYCVDCDAKGPRWASWNLGVFLCIRCAGIHRNLGVHISKVKSINLDSWTPEQIAMMEDMGNSKARAVYEAYLPDNYKRPSTSDQAMEQFIRAKYEHKKYIAKEWVPPKPRSAPTYYSDTEDKKLAEKKSVPKPILTIPGAAAGTTAAQNAKKEKAEPVQVPVQSASSRVLDLSTRVPVQQARETAPSVDLMADVFGDTPVSQPLATSSHADLLGLSTSQPAIATTGVVSRGDNPSNDLFQVGEEKNKSTKDSIMALYGSGSLSQSAPAMYANQNMYLAQPIGQMGMYNNMMMPPVAMMASYPAAGAMMGQQPMMAAGYFQQPVGQPHSMMGVPHGVYNQQQQQMLYAQQLQAQMANMNLGHQPQFPQQAVPATGSAGASWAGNMQTNGQTLNFDLWN